jgi:hypothetical protein
LERFRPSRSGSIKTGSALSGRNGEDRVRVRSEIWVGAYVRRCNSGGTFAAVVRHGDDDAGAVYVKINRLDGSAAVYGPAPMSLDAPASIDRQFDAHIEARPGNEAECDRFLTRQHEFDPDIWVIEVEDRQGRHFLEEWMAPSPRTR